MQEAIGGYSDGALTRAMNMKEYGRVKFCCRKLKSILKILRLSLFRGKTVWLEMLSDPTTPPFAHEFRETFEVPMEPRTRHRPR